MAPSYTTCYRWLCSFSIEGLQIKSPAYRLASVNVSRYFVEQGTTVIMYWLLHAGALNDITRLLFCCEVLESTHQESCCLHLYKNYVLFLHELINYYIYL